MYTTKMHKTTTDVATYIEKYVNVEEFLRYCKECSNYNKMWCCPPYSFHPLELWKKYKKLDLYACEIFLGEELAGKKKTKDELNELENTIISTETRKLSKMLFEQEELYPGSFSLSAGDCHLCDKCCKPLGEPCRHPDKLRYSIESLGGDVGRTISSLMGIQIEWVTEGVLPSKFVLVCGLLRNEE